MVSNYIRNYELPFLLQPAELKHIRLAILYVTAVADSALKIPVDVDGQTRTVDLKQYHAFNSPGLPLEKLVKGEHNTLYTKLADWLRRQLDAPPTSYPTGPRYDLAIALQPRRRHWEHSVSLPHAADFAKPELDCPSPQTMLGDAAFDVDGKDVFELLFGREPQTCGYLLGAAFDAPEANPTRHPLRVHLLTDDDRLCHLPWGKIEYEGSHLVADGWTVEFHRAGQTGFPEFPSHTCYFPGKVGTCGGR